MKEVQIKEERAIQLRLLKEIDDFCEKNGITYFLTYGTLLGAIRHNGYIPWDDDIDILMPRPDYERFINEYVSKNSFVVSPEHNRNYLYLFGKVSDKNTILIEDTALKTNLGIYIDVFPLDGLPDDKVAALKQIKRVRRWRNIYDIKRLVPISQYRVWWKSVVLIILKGLTFFVPYNFVLNRTLGIMKGIDYNTANYVMELNFPKPNRIVPKSLFAKTIKHQFEDGKYNIPEGYDAYLRSIFGDYMKLPPEDQRVTHHRQKVYYKNS